MTQSVGMNNSAMELLRLQQLSGAKTNGGINAANGSDESIMDFSSIYTPATEEAAALDYAQALSELNATNGVSTSGLTKEEIKDELEKLQEKREQIEEEMEAIESEIEELAQQAEENIQNALAQKEEETEQYDEEAQEALSKNIKSYVEANKEGGKGMTREELQENIKNSLPNKPQLAEAMATLTNANEQVNEIDSLLGDLNGKILEANELDSKIGNLQEEAKKAEEAEKQAAQNKCCDPIGFTTGEGENAAKYDFIIDDGNFDSTSDFLGAEGQWSAMQGLDTDGNNIVSGEELKAGNIKAVKTSADGSQSIVDLTEEFGDDFSIDLASYKQGGSHSAVNTTSDADKDGVMDQQLLGTFNVNANGQTLKGYNTLDDNDWLSSNYGIQSDNSVNPFETSGNPENSEFLNPDDFSEELQAHVNFFNTYKELNEEYRKEMIGAYEDLGLTDEEIKELNTSIQSEADEKANSFKNSLTSDKSEDTKNKDNQTQMNGNDKKDERKEKEELLAA